MVNSRPSGLPDTRVDTQLKTRGIESMSSEQAFRDSFRSTLVTSSVKKLTLAHHQVRIHSIRA
jgi:hypothetical protein